jgi:hypothetical protein
MVETLHELYGDKTIGILPEFSSDIVFWLADAGLRLQELKWADLPDADEFNADGFPLIVYAGGEHYRSSVRSDGDVIRSLQRYLRDGGMLMAVPQLPYPFFYDETGRAKIAAGRVGLPIRGSKPPRWGAEPEPFATAWESPPTDVQLTFHINTQHLSGLDATAPFPATGDLRWRPATPSVVGADDRYVPLASLRDRQGRRYGDGVAFVEYASGELAGGRTLYVWMRMPDVLGKDAAFFELMKFTADQLGCRASGP